VSGQVVEGSEVEVGPRMAKVSNSNLNQQISKKLLFNNCKYKLKNMCREYSELRNNQQISKSSFCFNKHCHFVAETNVFIGYNLPCLTVGIKKVKK
jgi:hypothetical protein